jgi:hypothetical protein
MGGLRAILGGLAKDNTGASPQGSLRVVTLANTICALDDLTNAIPSSRHSWIPIWASHRIVYSSWIYLTHWANGRQISPCSQNTLTPMVAHSSAGHVSYPGADFVNAAS